MKNLIISFFYCTSIFAANLTDIKTSCASLKSNILVIVKNDDAIELLDSNSLEKIGDLPSNLQTEKCAISDDASLIVLVSHKNGELWKNSLSGYEKYDFKLSKPLTQMDDIACGYDINQGTRQSYFFIAHIYPYEDGLVKEKLSLSHRKKTYFPINMTGLKLHFLSKYDLSSDKVIVTCMFDKKATHVLVYDFKKKVITFSYVIPNRIYYINFSEDNKKCLLAYSNPQNTCLIIDFNTYEQTEYILDKNMLDIYLNKSGYLYVINKDNLIKNKLIEKIKSKL